MKKIYLFIPALFLSLGLLAQTPAPEVQKVDSLKTGTLEIGDRGTVTTVKEETIVANELDVLSVLDTTTERRSFSKEELEVLLEVAGNKLFTKNYFFESPGNYSWVVPPDINVILVETFGGGGGGGYSDIGYQRTGGGGGGAFTQRVLSIGNNPEYDLQPGDTCTIKVGA